MRSSARWSSPAAGPCVPRLRPAPPASLLATDAPASVPDGCACAGRSAWQCAGRVGLGSGWRGCTGRGWRAAAGQAGGGAGVRVRPRGPGVRRAGRARAAHRPGRAPGAPLHPDRESAPLTALARADLALRLAGEAERQGWRMRQATSQATPLPRQRAARARCMLCMCGTGGAADCWHKARPLRLCRHSYRVSACSQAT